MEPYPNGDVQMSPDSSYTSKLTPILGYGENEYGERNEYGEGLKVS